MRDRLSVEMPGLTQLRARPFKVEKLKFRLGHNLKNNKSPRDGLNISTLRFFFLKSVMLIMQPLLLRLRNVISF